MSIQNRKNQSVAIIGMGCMFPRASDLKEFWRVILNGENGITDVPKTHWSVDDYYHSNPKHPDHTYCRKGGFLPPVSYDPAEFGIPPNSLEATDTSQLLSLVVAKKALEDAGYGAGRDFNRDKTSVILGATGTQELVIPLGARLGHPIWRKALLDSGIDTELAEEVMERISASYVSWQENSFPGLLGNVIAGRITNRLDLGGTNCVVDAACASSMGAVNLAILELITGRSDMTVTGGVDTLNDIFMHMCFSQTGVLSHTSDAMPFSENADGTVLGEGIGILVMKRLEDAEKDGDRIYAVVKSVGSSSDGKSQSIYAPNAVGQAKALRMAYRDADIDPGTVELIEAHGTGTRVGDAVEFSALKDVFTEGKRKGDACALGSVKSNIGHAKAAAGAAGLIKAALALHHKVLPPTLKAQKPDPKLNIQDSPFYLNPSSRPWLARENHPRRSGVSAFGFGGSNFHMVLEEYKPKKQAVSWDGKIAIAALSAMQKEELPAKLSSLQQDISQYTAFEDVVRITSDLNRSFSAAENFRILLVLERAEEHNNQNKSVLETIRKAIEAIEKPDMEKIAENNIYFSGPVTKSKLAFVFPGQGSQYPEMAKDLISLFPMASEALENFNRIHQKEYPEPQALISDRIFPLPQTDTNANEDNLRSTDIAQPAIGAVSLGMLKTLNHFGLKPDAVCGHSYGELPALYAAGMIDEDDLMSLSVKRGKYMAAAGQGDSTMLAVKAPLAEIDAMLSEHKLDVVLANRNAPQQGVLSGSIDAIEQAKQICKEKKFRAVPLPVAAAFHSKFVQKAAKPFLQAVKTVKMNPPRIPVYANTTGEPYPDDLEKAATLLGEQLLNPVDFVKEIENLHESGVRSFVEVGPKPVLTGLVKAILKGKDFNAIALDNSSGKKSGIADLAQTLCLLASEGHDVDFTKWENPEPPPRKQKMSIPLSGANYRSDVKQKPPRPPKPFQAKVTVEKPPKPQPKPADQIPAKVTPDLSKNVPSQASVTSNSNSHLISEALHVVSESLKSMQALQMQTAETHKKFLETQTEAGKNLQLMMERTRNMTQAAMGLPPGPAYYQPEISARSFAPKPPATTPSAAPAPKKTTPLPKPAKADRSRQDIQKNMLAVVSVLTGYPVDMLDPSMDIEADLGIDSIKRVEILSAFEEKMPGMPSISNEIMGELKTLGQIIDYLTELSGASAAIPPSDTASAPLVFQDTIEQTMMLVVSELTGYPVDMLDPSMDIEADLGIDSIKRVEILSAFEEKMPGMPPISNEIMGELKTLGQIIDYLLELSGTSAAIPPSDTASAPLVSQDMSRASQNTIEQIMMLVVSELTGYPVDMLEPNMDIEADLGIDSIKRVEILSAFEEKMPGMPSISNEIMGELKTLGQIVSYLTTLSNGADTENGTALSAREQESLDVSYTYPLEPANVPEEIIEEVERRVISIVEKPLQSTNPVTIPQDRIVYILDDQTGLGKEISQVLESKKIKTSMISGNLFADRENLSKTLHHAGGLILIPDVDLLTDRFNKKNRWNEKDEQFLKNAFLAANITAQNLMASASEKGGLFATITRLDGAFGFTGQNVLHPLQGGLAGLAKTAAIEWEEVCCHAVDIAPDWKDVKAVAIAACDELLHRGPVEIGLTETRRCVLELTAAPSPEGKIRLDENDVVIVTGGARGVTAACTYALAKHAKPTIILMGRSPLPSPEPAWTESLKDESAIKKAILQNEFSGKKVTPVQVDKVFKKYMAGREIMKNLSRLKSTGAAVEYMSVDVRDIGAVNSILEDVRSNYGRISGIIHGAGILEDRFIKDKTLDQFSRVFDTKAKGLNVLLEATAKDKLKYIVFFSSVAARMGNKGQVDYAMANEVLNKIAQQEARARKNCRVVSINWGPWDGGMVNPSLKKEFSRMNISLIPIKAGALAMIYEMMGDQTHPVEVVIGATIAVEEPQIEKTAPAPKPRQKPRSIPKRNGTPLHPFEQTIDIDAYPILEAHVLNGKPVVPFAIMAEWFGHAAMRQNPGFSFCGIDDMRLLSGIKLQQSERQTIQLIPGETQQDGSCLTIGFELVNNLEGGKKTICSKARAVLSDTAITPPSFNKPVKIGASRYGKSIEECYDTILFHGSQLKGIQEIVGYSQLGMVAGLSSAPAPDKWIKDPYRPKWISDPLILDAAYQMAILWCHETTGLVSLPSYSAGYRQYREEFPAGGVTAILEVKELTDHKMKGDFAFLDADETVIATITGYEAIMDASLMKAFQKK